MDMTKEAKLALFMEWLAVIYGPERSIEGICLYCPPSKRYFEAKKKASGRECDIEWDFHYVPEYGYIGRGCDGSVTVPTISREAAILAVKLALSGIGLDPQSVESYVKERRHPRGFDDCLGGDELLVAVKALLDAEAKGGIKE